MNKKLPIARLFASVSCTAICDPIIVDSVISITFLAFSLWFSENFAKSFESIQLLTSLMKMIKIATTHCKLYEAPSNPYSKNWIWIGITQELEGDIHNSF